MSAVLEGLAEAVGIGFEDSFEASAAGSFWFGGGAVVGDEGETIGHVEDEARAVHCRCWSVVCGRDGGENDGEDGKSERKFGDRH